MSCESSVHGEFRQRAVVVQHEAQCGLSRADTPCPGKDLLGPYPTREEAERALEKVRERNREYDDARAAGND